MITFISTGNYSFEQTLDMLGIIPEFISALGQRPAREQLHTAYAHGGGWQPFTGFTLRGNRPKWELKYPGDPAYRAAAFAKLRDETIIIFPHAWVVVLQADGTWECARMD